MELVQCKYVWLKLHDCIKSYVKLCTTCTYALKVTETPSLWTSKTTSDLSYTIAMVGEYVTSYCLYSAHKLCQITWHSGLLAQLEQHIIVGIFCLSHDPRKTLELNIHGFHQEATNVQWL